MHLHRKKWLFTFLQPPKSALQPKRWKATTNSLEGGINAQLKLLARLHRGRGGERQRRMIEWWLHSKTHLPDDPIEVARQQRFGQDALAKVTALTQPNESQANQETGRPALLRQRYPNRVPTQHRHTKRAPRLNAQVSGLRHADRTHILLLNLKTQAITHLGFYALAEVEGFRQQPLNMLVTATFHNEHFWHVP